MREWSKSLYENSTSSRCWWFTPYDDGWDGSAKHGPDLREDEELRAIVEMEASLDPLPEWARKIAESSIRSVPPCGHYTFPKAYLETVNAIGKRQSPSFLHTCFTVDSKRKRQMADYG